MLQFLKLKKRQNIEGSIAVEATLSVPIAIIAILMLTLILKLLFIYENMDQAILNASDKMAVNEVYATLAHSDGYAEKKSRKLLLRTLVGESISEQGLEAQADLRIENGIVDIQIDEDFDPVSGVGNYTVTYDVQMIGNFPSVGLTHTTRVKSIWQFANNDNSSAGTTGNSQEDTKVVYTSTNGRENKIYHTHPDCRTLKKSWNTAGSIQMHNRGDLDGYRNCSFCSKVDAKSEQTK